MSAGEIRAGKAYVEAYTKDNTAPGLRSMSNRFSAFAGRLKTIGGVALGAGTAAAAAGTAAVLRAASVGSAVKDMADRTGMSKTAVQELGYAARQTGTGTEALETGVKTMQKNLVGGDAEISRVLNAVGTSFEQLRGLAPEEQFQKLAGAFKQLATDEERTYFATKMFGRGGAELIPLLNAGADGIQQFRDRAHELGLVMSDQDVDAAEEFGDRIQDLKEQFDAAAVKVGVALLPIAEKLVDLLSLMAEAVFEVAEEVSWFLDQVGLGRDPTETGLPPMPEPTLPPATLVPDIAKKAKEFAYSVKPSGMLGTFDAKSAAGLFVGDIQKEQLAELKSQSGKLSEIAKNTADNGGLAIT